MDLDGLRYAVTDYVKDRKYADGRLPLIVICVVLGLSLVWIGSFFVGGPSYRTPTPVLTPRDIEAGRINAELRTDERFMHVFAGPSHEDVNAIIVTGEVFTPEDLDALERRIKQITSTYAVSLGEILVMREP